MFLQFFFKLKDEGFPVSLQEYLTLLDGLDKEVVAYSVDDFYYFSRTVMVKHEQNLDRFDKLFGDFFKGIAFFEQSLLGNIPEDWLKKELQRLLSEEEKKKIEKMGGMDALYQRLQELFEEQKDRHQGGNKWIGTGGTSPFGSQGYNPEGFRMGAESAGNRTAIKVWDKRSFHNLSDRVELNTRNIKMALKHLRLLTREGIPDELDLNQTIHKTSANGGFLDIAMVPSKQNRVKVLLFMDVGGSMDDHIDTCEQLFSAAKHEFKHLQYYYFHNCIYESVWENNRRRQDRIPTLEILHRFNKDYKVIVVGDAAMSPYELAAPGGSVEHYNDEAGIAWLQRLKDQFPYMIWLNPNADYGWQYFQTTLMIREFMDNRMFPLTLEGLAKAMKALKDRRTTYDEVWVKM